ncbi:MAG: ribonuclease HII [Gemmatimonadota bacterium]|nr:ribonuclease HII [Gemmatimonadota bacterium]
MKSGKRKARRWDPVERELRATVGPLIAGVDEVGRGPLAGPVVACAVIMPNARAIPGVDDSKCLTARERLRLAGIIRRRAVAIGLGAASNREIDRVNIYHATTLAIRRALARLAATPDHVVLDGRAIRGLGVPHTAIVGGDARCYSIACASIIAKVTRDRVMKALAKRYPTYGWDRNVGYCTAKHLAGLAATGATPHHRRSFVPVYQLALELADAAPAPADETHAEEVLAVVDPGAALDLATDLIAPPGP